MCLGFALAAVVACSGPSRVNERTLPAGASSDSIELLAFVDSTVRAEMAAQHILGAAIVSGPIGGTSTVTAADAQRQPPAPASSTTTTGHVRSPGSAGAALARYGSSDSTERARSVFEPIRPGE